MGRARRLAAPWRRGHETAADTRTPPRFILAQSFARRSPRQSRLPRKLIARPRRFLRGEGCRPAEKIWMIRFEVQSIRPDAWAEACFKLSRSEGGTRHLRLLPATQRSGGK